MPQRFRDETQDPFPHDWKGGTDDFEVEGQGYEGRPIGPERGSGMEAGEEAEPKDITVDE